MLIEIFMGDTENQCITCRNSLKLNTQRGIIEVFKKPYKYISFYFHTEYIAAIRLYNDNNELIYGVNAIEKTYYNAIPTRLKTLADFCSSMINDLKKHNYHDNPDFI